MIKLLICIAQKHTKIPLAMCEGEFKNNYHLGDIIKKAEQETGLKVDGYSNYIEWVEI